MKRLLLVVVAVLLAAGTAFAQSSEPSIEIVDVNGARYAEGGQTTMLIDFSNFTTAPDPATLSITANGEPVSNLEVRSLGESAVPVRIALVIDASGSMQGAPIEAAKASAQAFVDQKRTEDQIALITFADEVVVSSGFTSNGNELTTRIGAIVADGETAFNDAVVKTVELFGESGSENFLRNAIVLTDGDDTVSVATLDEALAAVSGADIKFFGVALESPDFNPGPVQQVAEAGDGLFLSTPNPEELSGLYLQIGQEISNTLVARFVSPISAPGIVTFAASYGDTGLSSSVDFQVSGFATTTSVPPEATTTVTFAPPSSVVIDSPLFLDSGTLILVGAVGLGLTLFLFIVILFGREDEEGGGRFAKRLEAYGRKGSGNEEKRPWIERIPLINKFSQAAEEEVKRRGLLSGMNSALEQANIPMSPGEAVLALFGIAAVGGFILGIFNNLVVGLISFVVILLIFLFLISWTGSREKKRFEKQLPDTLTLMATSLRAGYSLLQAVEAVASEAQDPTAREFGRALVEARLGRSVPDSLSGIATRTQSQDFEWAVMAIEIQREVGGNLAEVLQTVATTMLQRNRLRGEIKALTAEGRLSAIILGALPFVMFGFLYVTNIEYLTPLLEETVGQIAIGLGVLLIAAGIFWLKKIVDIDV